MTGAKVRSRRSFLANLITHNPDSSESVINPQWRSDNQLFALSDRDNWWRPYAVQDENFSRQAEPYFYGPLGFEPADDLPTVGIDNLEGPSP